MSCKSLPTADCYRLHPFFKKGEAANAAVPCLEKLHEHSFKTLHSPTDPDQIQYAHMRFNKFRRCRIYSTQF